MKLKREKSLFFICFCLVLFFKMRKIFGAGEEEAKPNSKNFFRESHNYTPCSRRERCVVQMIMQARQQTRGSAFSM
jgi:hypothetical protein